MRAAITEAIPILARSHRIPYEGKDFVAFVEVYDKILLDRECGSPHPENCLLYFVKQGNWKGVNRAVELGARNWESALYYTAHYADLDFVRFFWRKLRQPRSTDEGKRKLTLGFINSTFLGVVLNNAFLGAVKSGKKEIVDFFIRKGANAWDRAFQEAVRHGYLHFYPCF